MQPFRPAINLLYATLLLLLSGCSQQSAIPQGADQQLVVAEGVIFSVEYKLENGGTGGFTRMNSANAVPGGNGSWNVDATGRLTDDYLIITYPQKQDLGLHIIPTHRLVDIQFGDGGIKDVNENKSRPSE